MRRPSASMTGSRKPAKSLFLAALVAVFVAVGLVSSAWSVGEPTITSDRADYRPGDTVTLSGTNWQADSSVHVIYQR